MLLMKHVCREHVADSHFVEKLFGKKIFLEILNTDHLGCGTNILSYFVSNTGFWKSNIFLETCAVTNFASK